MKKSFTFFLAAVAVLSTGFLSSCSSDEPAPAPEFTDLSMSEAESRANAALEGFNNNFFKEAFAATPEGNVSVSPLSASMLLSMVCNVVDEEVRAQILTALGSNDLDALNTLNRRYMDVLPALDENVTMTIANGYWYHNDYTLSPSFSNILSGTYGGVSRAGDFDVDFEGVARDINSWVNEQSAGMIPSIIDRPELLIGNYSVLVDALYVKGAWAGPFDREKTAPAEFHGAKGTTTVDMMYRFDRTYFQSGTNFNAVRIPLGNASFEVILVLPDEGVSVDELIEGNVHSQLNFGSAYRTHLYLPRVDFASGTMDLNDIFAEMGVDKLDEMREISQFTQTVNAKHNIKQKTAVRFNEEGAEASAITWDVEETYYPGLNPASTPEFRADRPFLFFIDEASTGAAILWGCIRDL